MNLVYQPLNSYNPSLIGLGYPEHKTNLKKISSLTKSIINTLVNGLLIKALVDSGSTDSFITLNWYKN